MSVDFDMRDQRVVNTAEWSDHEIGLIVELGISGIKATGRKIWSM